MLKGKYTFYYTLVSYMCEDVMELLKLYLTFCFSTRHFLLLIKLGLDMGPEYICDITILVNF